MTQEQQDDSAHSARRIHSTLGGTTTFWRGYTVGELLLFVVPPFLALAVSSMPFVPAGLILPAFGLALAIDVTLFVLHRACPEHLRLTQWLFIRLRWRALPGNYDAGDSGWSPEDAVRLKAVYPEAVERIDGAMVGAVQVDPANMALKDEESWASAVRSLTDLINSTLDFDAKIYVTTHNADNAQYVEAHEQRLDDPDVTGLPVLSKLVEDFVDRRTDDHGRVDDGTPPVREYYLVTWVTDDDVLDLQRDDRSLLSGLAELPVFERVFSGYQSRQLTDRERTKHKRRKLAEQLEELRRGADNLYRCRARPVEPTELARLVKEYWCCRTERYGDVESATASFPYGDHLSEAEDADLEDIDDESGDIEAVDPEDLPEEEGIERAARQHQSFVAPADIDWRTDHTVINGETYTRTFWIDQFPEQPENGLFERLLLDTDLSADVSINVNPYEDQSAVDLVSDWIATLQTNRSEMDELTAEDMAEDIQEAKYIRRLVRRNETSLVRAGVFIRITADDEEELRRKTNTLRSIVRDSPANCTLKRVVRSPEERLATVSPIGRNELGRDRLSTMTAEAVGAMFPFSSNYLQMSEGIEYGTHGHNESEIHVDPWSLETGHSELVTGMPGAGKTHAAQARALRMLERREDVMQVIVDPVGDMRGTAEALDAKYITVSGKTPLNPCEMHPTPREVLEQSRDMQPVAAKKDEVYGVVENFLASRDIDLEMHSGVVTHVIDRIFEDSDIDPLDVSTHTPENSPTMQDFLDVLEEMSESPEEYNFSSETVRDRVSEYAAELLIALQPFREGSTYENLSKRSNLDLLEGDEKVVYLDLQQVEESGDGIGKQSFIMQLLMSTIYQQAKRAEKKVEVVIDEAHYLFDDTSNLEFINQIARHQRHAGIRLVMLSQTLQEFYDEGVAEEIISMCPIKVHHREPGLDEATARKADLTTDQQWFVKNAEAGNADTGRSQALVRVDDHGDYPLNVATTDLEKEIIEYDPDAEAVLDELVAQSEPEHLGELRDLVRHQRVRTALERELGLPDSTVDRLLREGLTGRELVEGLVTAIERNHVTTDGEDDTVTIGDGGTLEVTDDDAIAEAVGDAAEGSEDADELARSAAVAGDDGSEGVEDAPDDGDAEDPASSGDTAPDWITPGPEVNDDG